MSRVSFVKGLIVTATLLMAVPAYAGDVTAGVDFATAYVFRGAAINNRAVMEPSLVAATDVGLSFGIWGNFDMASDSSGSPKSGEFSEIDLYGSYTFPIESDVFDLALGYTEYTYPGGEVDADREFNLVSSFDVMLQPYFGVYYGVDGAVREQWYLEAGIGHDFELAEDLTLGLSGSLAGLVQGAESSADDGLSYARFGAKLSYKFVSAAYYYYGETDGDVLAVDTNHVGIVSVAYQF